MLPKNVAFISRKHLRTSRQARYSIMKSYNAPKDPRDSFCKCSIHFQETLENLPAGALLTVVGRVVVLGADLTVAGEVGQQIAHGAVVQALALSQNIQLQPLRITENDEKRGNESKYTVHYGSNCEQVVLVGIITEWSVTLLSGRHGISNFTEWSACGR